MAADAEEGDYDEVIDEYTEPDAENNSHGPLAGVDQTVQPTAAVANRPSGGPLGFFGQGGLFDVTSGNGIPPNSLLGVNQLQGASFDDVRPVVEFNVPGSLVDAVSSSVVDDSNL